MKTFKQYIKMEEDAVAGAAAAGPSTTSGVASYESPIGKKQPTAVVEDNGYEVDANAKKIKTVTSRGV